ncbi:putative isoamyl alcohol oxidase protein [Phaeoacremonium minimum UCRPA7]|uniref:Putative isoamyl alcohol oxidase protein n=1 Tax=Phaeoacremonium minimum (strain UCR-PA7) TaxID=1286976 RepID=R8BNP9_PHAM7|nr:putative isoamyl alcohol oxidase protein [Phaeoacremonium minimum UCRPA7]EOO01028.1 putative isoamyl alcohol oxidase protein [Phaeoacremonium minimum UCRPA7]
MPTKSFWAVPIMGVAAVGAIASGASCKCAPGDSCWPSIGAWDKLNATVSGKLIATKPIALPCYPGPDYDAAACGAVQVGLSQDSFVSENPIGLDYPINITCPPINVAANATNITADSCTLGTNPLFAVNVTEIDDIVAAVRFAQKNKVRLVIKSTGHDVLGRNDGYGSLEVWLRYFRKGITLQDKFKSSTGCTASGWDGSAMKMAGAYMWGEGYAVARENNFVVVGGGSATVCGTGGWVQGGGHGPGSHTFGLGADQVLEAEIVLASGRVVTANSCQNQDLYYAIRGGGPSTYGVVVSTTVKTYPQVNVTVQNLSFAPRDSASQESFLDALADLYLEVPSLVDAGFAGYTHWQYEGPGPIFDNYTTGYTHNIYTLNSTLDYAVAAGQTLLDKINHYNDTIYVNSSYVTYWDYWSFFHNTSADVGPVGILSASGSRLLDGPSLSNATSVRELVGVLAGDVGQGVINVMSIVSGGKVWKDASQAHSAVLPAWRKAYVHQTVARIIGNNLADEEKQAIFHDITYNKIGFMKTLAPDSGSYMNEADFNDPDWKVDFYGENYPRLLAIKEYHDPESLFYCPTCVGSDKWQADSVGQLCRV